MRRRLGRILGITALIFGGIASTLVLLTLLMMAFPALIFGPTTYYQRTTANQQLRMSYYSRDGDLFVALPGSIRPPQDDQAIAEIDIMWDELGFRMPAQPADRYPIAVYGDSFTESVNTPLPYADVLAAGLNTGVRNYGFRAYGPREVAQAAEETAASEARNWVIYGYFSGNDLGDAVRGDKVDTSPSGVWSALFERVNTPKASTSNASDGAGSGVDEEIHYDFPMPVIIGGNYYEMAFLSYYWWWHTGNPDDYARSQNLAIVGDSLDRIAAAAPEDACLLLMFIPTKEQLYYPYIYETERQWVLGVYHQLVVDDETGQFWMRPQPLTPADEPAFVASLTHQRDALQTLLATKPRWRFFDLLPVFEQAVAEGQLLYYPYDSHWNQDGHNLAGKALADYLRGAPECGLFSET